MAAQAPQRRNDGRGAEVASRRGPAGLGLELADDRVELGLGHTLELGHHLTVGADHVALGHLGDAEGQRDRRRCHPRARASRRRSWRRSRGRRPRCPGRRHRPAAHRPRRCARRRRRTSSGCSATQGGHQWAKKFTTTHEPRWVLDVVRACRRGWCPARPGRPGPGSWPPAAPSHRSCGWPAAPRRRAGRWRRRWPGCGRGGDRRGGLGVAVSPIGSIRRPPGRDRAGRWPRRVGGQVRRDRSGGRGRPNRAATGRARAREPTPARCPDGDDPGRRPARCRRP